MKTLVLYIGITVVGYLTGAKAGIKPMPRFLTAVIAFLVFVMGSRIGASEEIIASLPDLTATEIYNSVSGAPWNGAAT